MLDTLKPAELFFTPGPSCPAMREIQGKRGYFWYDAETEEQIRKTFCANYLGLYQLHTMYDNIGEGYIVIEFDSNEDRLEFFLRYGDKFY